MRVPSAFSSPPAIQDDPQSTPPGDHPMQDRDAEPGSPYVLSGEPWDGSHHRRSARRRSFGSSGQHDRQSAGPSYATRSFGPHTGDLQSSEDSGYEHEVRWFRSAGICNLVNGCDDDNVAGITHPIHVQLARNKISKTKLGSHGAGSSPETGPRETRTSARLSQTQHCEPIDTLRKSTGLVVTMIRTRFDGKIMLSPPRHARWRRSEQQTPLPQDGL